MFMRRPIIFLNLVVWARNEKDGKWEELQEFPSVHSPVEEVKRRGIFRRRWSRQLAIVDRRLDAVDFALMVAKDDQYQDVEIRAEGSRGRWRRLRWYTIWNNGVWVGYEL